MTPEKDYLPSKFQTSNTRIANPHSDLEIDTNHKDKTYSQPHGPQHQGANTSQSLQMSEAQRYFSRLNNSIAKQGNIYQ